MEKRSLGMIETRGIVPAIEAADAGTKAANVTLLGYERAGGGRITVKFKGDVAAVTASVAAGVAAAEKVGKVIAKHVIPRPDRQLHIVPDGRHPTPEEKRTGHLLEMRHDMEAHEIKAPPGPETPSEAKKEKKSAKAPDSRSKARDKKSEVQLKTVKKPKKAKAKTKGKKR
jgi:ethanolamine utilization protein EutM